ncbi:MAG TPA: hypothetical protein PLD25_15355 [Chloroflexota bacterium]|nr:hypothetical protein [Chloroflexota bacterium]HUM70142.1 hypothetical protein [Chloroflexota bacterium]
MSLSRAKRIEYYKGAAAFWHEAILLQGQRCLEAQADADTIRVDLNFYVVSVQRLREVAVQIRDRLRQDSIRPALERFDTRWPRFKELRNSEEHILGPSGHYPLGIWYFRHAVVDLQPYGKVEYIVHLEAMESSINELFIAIREALAEPL